MELLSNAPAHRSVPDRYVFPPDKRPALLSDDRSPDVAFPVIDLHGGDLPVSDHRRRQVAAEIVRAGKEFGFFQVVNHGVGEGVVRGFREVAAGFFAMPAEDKLPYCSYDMSKCFRLATNSAVARMSVATHVHPTDGCRIRPAPEIVDEKMTPAKYREFAFSEFMEAYDAADASREEVLESFKINHD